MERQKEFVRALGRAARNIEHGLYGSAIVELQTVVRLLADYQKETGESVSPNQLAIFDESSQKEKR